MTATKRASVSRVLREGLYGSIQSANSRTESPATGLSTTLVHTCTRPGSSFQQTVPCQPRFSRTTQLLSCLHCMCWVVGASHRSEYSSRSTCPLCHPFHRMHLPPLQRRAKMNRCSQGVAHVVTPPNDGQSTIIGRLTCFSRPNQASKQDSKTARPGCGQADKTVYYPPRYTYLRAPLLL